MHWSRAAGGKERLMNEELYFFNVMAAYVGAVRRVGKIIAKK
jgi:hypothetical protein